MEDTYIQPADPRDTSDSEESSDGEASIKSTRSCSSYNLEPILENGRRYCDEIYFMPNDEAELTRLNILHQIYLILLDGNLTSIPLNPKFSQRILDIGTGPGDWAIEMSAEYPNAKIIASDIGVFDSGLGHLELPNVDFQLADAQSEWTYHQPFDLVHIRGLSGAFRDWSYIYQQAFTHLRPGGYIEIADADPAADTITSIDEINFDSINISDPVNTTTNNTTNKSDGECLETSTQTTLQKYTTALRNAAKEAGYPRDLAHLNTTALSAAGFVDIRVQERSVPIGLWPEDIHEKTLGKMTLIALLEGLEAYALRPLTASGKWNVDEARGLCEMVREEVLNNEKGGLRGIVRVVTARKPVSFAQKRKDVLARARARVRNFRGDDGEDFEWDFEKCDDGGGGGGDEAQDGSGQGIEIEIDEGDQGEDEDEGEEKGKGHS
ncbi:hypothetical protein PENSTE_c001G05037 [Penicillium steckii]|uniref:Methyltransferase domain-containing protein n=1 Tax=Penicillium steckii TaxID=303698 RepID=A0A1V6TZU5_9EURO|nr:hypothetical protein PENSTE_c001G05037 [Penicillium steckii]